MNRLFTAVGIITILGLCNAPWAAAQQALPRIGGLAQIQYRVPSPETGETSHQLGIPLLDLVASGTAVDPRLSYQVILEATSFGDSETLGLLEGWMQYQPTSSLNVRAGQLLVPFSRQFYTSPAEQLLVGGSAADAAFALGRSKGVQAVLKAGRLTVDAAAVAPLAPLGGSESSKELSSVSAVGRLTWDVLDPYGYSESVPHRVDAPQLTLGLAAVQNSPSATSASQNVRSGDRTTSATLDAGFRWSVLTVQGAGYLRSNRAVGFGAERLLDHGYYLQTGLQLSPGRWEVAARTARSHFDQPNVEGAMALTQEYSVGVNRYLEGHNAKLQAHFAGLRHETFDGTAEWQHRVFVQTQIGF
jgi:hypothetical protein